MFTFKAERREHSTKSRKIFAINACWFSIPTSSPGWNLTAKGQPVEFGRNAKKEWQIVKPKPQRADNGQVEELVRKLGDAEMDTSAPDEDAAKAAPAFAGGTRVGTATVTDSAGSQTLDVRKKGNDYFAKSSAVQGVFKIGSDSAKR